MTPKYAHFENENPKLKISNGTVKRNLDLTFLTVMA
jgi:hypothetical protein